MSFVSTVSRVQRVGGTGEGRKGREGRSWSNPLARPGRKRERELRFLFEEEMLREGEGRREKGERGPDGEEGQ